MLSVDHMRCNVDEKIEEYTRADYIPVYRDTFGILYTGIPV